MKSFLNQHGKKFGVSIGDFSNFDNVAERYDMIYPVNGVMKPVIDDVTTLSAIERRDVSIARGPIFDHLFFENIVRKEVQVSSDLLIAYTDGYIRGCNALNYLVVTEDSHDLNGNVIFNGMKNVSGEEQISDAYAYAKKAMTKRANSPKVCFSMSDIGLGIVKYCLSLSRFGFVDAIFLNLTARHITDGFFNDVIGLGEACKALGVEFWLTKLYITSDTYPFDEYDKVFHVLINSPGITGVAFLGENFLRDQLIEERLQHPHGVVEVK